MKRMILCGMAACLVFASAPAAFSKDAPKAKVKHVVMVGFDGLASCALNLSKLPTFGRLCKEGKWTPRSRSVLPSSSAINWATLMMGAPSEMHGFRTWGSKNPDLEPIFVTKKGLFPCIFSVVRDQIPDAYTVSTWDWPGIAFIHQREDVSASKEFSCSETGKMIDWFLGQLKANRPVLSFLYFSEPDNTGHGSGWESEAYQQRLQEIDGRLKKVVDFLERDGWMKDTVVIVISDHGGKGKSHGGSSMREMQSPFIMWGRGIRPCEMKSTMMGFDVAPTVAELLGLTPPDAWRGRSALNR